MDPSAAKYLEALTAEVRSVLGDRLVGVYPCDEVAFDDFQPARDEIRVLVVVTERLSESEEDGLDRRLSKNSLPCPAVGLDLAVITQEVAASPGPRPEYEQHILTTPDQAMVLDLDGGHRGPDLPVLMAHCRQQRHPAFGEQPRRLVLQSLLFRMGWGQENEAGLTTVLHGCRAWRYAVEGDLVSATTAARWTAERVTGPDLEVVEAALARHTGADEAAHLDSHAALLLTFRIGLATKHDPAETRLQPL